MDTRRRRRRSRCPCCGELFWPDHRVKSRQRYCSQRTCQQARRAAYQRQYRQGRRSEYAGRRLADALAKHRSGDRAPPDVREPFDRIPWEEVEAAFADSGAAAAIALCVVLRIVIRWLSKQSGKPSDDSEDASGAC